MCLPSSHKILETPSYVLFVIISILPLKIGIMDNYNFKFKVKKTRVCNYGINLKKNYHCFRFKYLTLIFLNDYFFILYLWLRIYKLFKKNL